MNFKKIYWLGVFLLFVGLLTIMTPELPRLHEKATLKLVLAASLVGLIPTLLGIYLIEKSNKSK